jgi:glycosidase
MQLTLDNYPQGQFGAFLRNHDMDRTLSVLDGNENKAKSAATFLLTSPGVPFIYYGEEIGQQGVRTGNSDEARRLPLQWTAEEYTAGFTTGTPWRAPFNDYETRNIAAQDADPASILNHYRKLIRIRDRNEALRVGEWTFVDSNNASIAAFIRHTDDNVILTIVNLGSKPIEEYGLDLAEGPLQEGDTALSQLKLEPLASPEVTAAGGFEGYHPVRVLEPYGNYVIKLR